MAYLLRTVRRRNWFKEHDKLPWLEPGEVPSDSISEDLTTSQNSLSLWYVETEDDIARVLAAISTTRSRIVDIDYRLLDRDVVVANNFRLIADSATANTADSGANLLHVDLVELSATRLVEFAKLLQGVPEETLRARGRDLRSHVAQGVRSGYIRLDALQAKVDPKDEVWELLSSSS